MNFILPFLPLIKRIMLPLHIINQNKGTLKTEDILEIKRRLATQQRIAIVIHYNPDGDAIGSALALKMFFQQKGHQADILSPNNFPTYLSWMPQSETIYIATQQFDTCQKIIELADMIFCLDFNAFNRIGVLENLLTDTKKFKVLIDHHIDPMPYFDISYSNSEQTSSTCELVYRFIADKMQEPEAINKAIAECLYVGIITDTGSLSYSCNHPSTYSVVSALVAQQIDCEQIHRLVYDTFSESRIRLLGYCLSNRLHIREEYATSFIFLTQKDLNTFHYQQGDTEGIVNYGLSIKTIRFTAFFTERDDRIRISFRSKGNFDVNRFARQHFNGGGHKNASGGNSYDDMVTTIAKFEALLKRYQQELLTPWD